LNVNPTDARARDEVGVVVRPRQGRRQPVGQRVPEPAGLNRAASQSFAGARVGVDRRKEVIDDPAEVGRGQG